jgi:hypothetical protein
LTKEKIVSSAKSTARLEHFLTDDSVLDGVLHKLGVGFQLYEPHYGIFVPATVRTVIFNPSARSQPSRTARWHWL